MNWEAIGAVAELLAAIGVIVSLVYLASQIRHSREQMRQNTRAVEAQVSWAIGTRSTTSFTLARKTPN